jgi:hypothetical protein
MIIIIINIAIMFNTRIKGEQIGEKGSLLIYYDMNYYYDHDWLRFVMFQIVYSSSRHRNKRKRRERRERKTPFSFEPILSMRGKRVPQ